MSDPASTSSGMPRGAPPSPIGSMVYPDVYLPQDVARAVAEQAMEAQLPSGALLASLIERFVHEHASELQASDVAGAETAVPENDWDAPGMVRRIVPLSEQVVQAVTRLALVRHRSVNALIRDIVQAAVNKRGDAPPASKRAPSSN